MEGTRASVSRSVSGNSKFVVAEAEQFPCKDLQRGGYMPPPTCLHVSWLVSLLVAWWVHASTCMPARVLAGALAPAAGVWGSCRCMPPPTCLHVSWLVSLLVAWRVHASTYMPACVLAGVFAGGLVGACLHLHACTGLGWRVSTSSRCLGSL
jgi:hypothetical protein